MTVVLGYSTEMGNCLCLVLLSGGCLTDLEHPNDVVFLREGATKLSCLLACLNESRAH